MSASSFQTEPAAVRADHDTFMIDITLNDPKAYTMPLHTQKKFILKPDWNLMEFVCEDNLLNFRDYEKRWLSPRRPNSSKPAHLSHLACVSHKRIMDISLGG